MWLAVGRSGTSETCHRGNIPVADELFDDHSRRLEGDRWRHRGLAAHRATVPPSILDGVPYQPMVPGPPLKGPSRLAVIHPP